MTDLRTAAQQAIALICSARLCEVNSMSSRQEMLRLMIEATDTLRAALAEPVLAPAPGYCKHCKQYTIEEPLPAKPLTQEEIAAEWRKASECAGKSEGAVTTSQFVEMFARAVERAHGIVEGA